MLWYDFDVNKNAFPETIRVVADWLWFVSSRWNSITDKNKFIEQNLQPLLTGGFRDPKVAAGGKIKYPSPALGTFVRNLGFIDDEYHISKLVELVAKGQITLEEYSLVILSKHRGWVDGKPVVNFLVLLCLYLRANGYCDVSEEMLETLSKVDGYSLTPTLSSDGNRNDMLYNYIKGTGLFDEELATSGSKRHLILKEAAKEIIDFIADNKDTIKLESCTDKNERYIYYGNITSGIFMLKGKLLPSKWKCFYPNLLSTPTPLQKIVYGAPGTGKSHGTDKIIKKYYPNREAEKDFVFRTTFHPDSDYSTFVGCYKPKKQAKDMFAAKGMAESEILKRFMDSKDSSKYGSIKARYLYEYLLYYQDLKKLGIKPASLAAKLTASGFTATAYTSEAGMMEYIHDWLVSEGYTNAELTYEFVPQSFTKAYVAAWKTKLEGENKPVFLVIEEINRGNCAQIFGDLFQLLDRNEDGFSEYPIKPDTDLGNYLKEEFKKAGLTSDKYKAVVDGEELLLPNNLYIWATMNTSDQSLFPIDSAFKRRWDWKFVPIKDAKEGWKIEFSFKTKADDGSETEEIFEQDWYPFLSKINKIIYKMTLSADKQMGYFFCKADNKVISLDKFVNKVAFYLWNDVFKDYSMGEGDLFKYKDGDKEEDIVFTSFFNEEGDINAKVAKAFIQNVMAWDEEKAK